MPLLDPRSSLELKDPATARQEDLGLVIDPNKVMDPENEMLDISKDEIEKKEDTVLQDLDKQIRGASKNQRDQGDTRRHNHDGTNSEPIDFKNLRGLLQVVSAVPTSKPTSIYQQILIYVNGATLRLYVYDALNDAWRYATLT